MKIVYVHSGIFPSNSPSETFIFYNALGLSQVFDKVYLFVCKNVNKNVEFLVREKFDINLPENLIVKTFESKFIKITHKFLFKSYYKYLIWLCSQEKIDAVITRNTNFLPYLIKLKTKYDIKVFYETHDFYANLSLRDDIDNSKKKRYEKLEKSLLPKLSGVFCLTNNQMQIYKKNLPDAKYYLARTGTQKRKIDEKKEKKFITYVGSFDEHKGLNVLLEAVERIDTTFKVLLIGGGNSGQKEKVKKMIKQKELKNKVMITGWLNKKELSNLLEQTVLGVLPLKPTYFNKYLTSPLKLFDFYSYHIPVIASDIPNLRELVLEGKTGLFFQPDNSLELSEKINYLVNNLDLVENMKFEIKKISQDLYWEERASKIYNFIKSSYE